jgi:hypothetical protein
LLRRHFVTKTFCYGDVLLGDFLSRRRFVRRRFVCASKFPIVCIQIQIVKYNSSPYLSKRGELFVMNTTISFSKKAAVNHLHREILMDFEILFLRKSRLQLFD